MSFICRELHVNLHQSALPIIDFLIETDSPFVYVYFFDIACFPSVTAWNFIEIAPATIGLLLPRAELLLILTTLVFIHRQRLSK